MASTTPVAILSSLLLQIKLLHVKNNTKLKWYNTAREWFNPLKLQVHYFFSPPNFPCVGVKFPV